MIKNIASGPERETATNRFCIRQNIEICRADTRRRSNAASLVQRFVFAVVTATALLLSSAPAWAQHSYYIAANGSDANSGTQAQSKSTPWQHAPGMSGCTGNCASYTPVAGDRFILRGGDTWANQHWYFQWSGSSSSPIYVGVDQTWYAGSTWARPILNSGNTTSDGFDFAGDYITLDNVEFTGLYFNNPSNPAHYIDLRITTGSTVRHNYFHGWSHGGTSDNCMLIYSMSNGSGVSILYNVFDGSDTTNGGDSCGAVWGLPGAEVGYNYFNRVVSGFVGYTRTFHDNVVDYLSLSFDTTDHGNMFENNTSNNTIIYNNVLRHGWPAGMNVTLWDAATGTDYIFNNVIYDTTTANIIDFGLPLSGSPGAEIMFNNTVECGPDSNPTVMCAANIKQAVTFKNNHWIGPSATGANSVYTLNSGTASETSDLAQSKVTANGQGYTMSNGFASTDATDSTVGAGTNLTSTCNAINDPAAAAACKQSTTFACLYNATTHTVSCPAVTPVARPSTGAWDIGAYQFTGSSQGTTPTAPTGLTATVW